MSEQSATPRTDEHFEVASDGHTECIAPRAAYELSCELERQLTAQGDGLKEARANEIANESAKAISSYSGNEACALYVARHIKDFLARTK